VINFHYNRFLLTGSAVYIVLVLAIFIGCAAISPPTGGPEDKRGPVLISTIPENQSTNISDLDYIEFIFDEHIQIRNPEVYLSITPSLDYKPEIKVKKKRIIIENLKSLKDNTTYIFSFGRSVQDVHGNFVDKEVKLAFSTGEELNKAEIRGKIYNIPEKMKCFVLAYNMDRISVDTLLNYSWDYIVETEKDGNFVLNYIAPGRYRLLSICTKRSYYKAGQVIRFAGVSIFNELKVFHKDQVIGGIKFYVTEFDIEPLKVTGMNIDSVGVIKLNFNKPLKEDSVRNFLLYCSDNSLKRYDILARWVESEGKNLNVIVNDKILERGGKLYYKNVRDIYGNKSGGEIKINAKEVLADTIPPAISRMYPSSKSSRVNPKFDFIRVDFSEAVMLMPGYMILKVDNDTMRYSDIKIDDNTVLIYPSISPLVGKTIELIFNGNKITDVNNNIMGDTLVIYHFKTVEENNTGSVSGKISSDFKDKNKLRIRLVNVDDNYTMTTRVGENAEFYINYLLPGDYSIFVWYDVNENGVFDTGSLIPYRECEPFWFIPGKVSVRARWETAGLEISLD